ncbi:MAG: hypothetical protein EOP11_09975 [Proteobacteria bacterium]|nr:MAG: hypothetical protein EOP11_09975 [Pseudomonadota bacterium]
MRSLSSQFAKILFGFLLLPAFASANDVIFTTVFYDDGGQVYVGLKKGEGDSAESQVITFPYPLGDRIQIPLPEEIKNRDVVGLIPEKNKLFVLTHSSRSAKDGPMLHVFDKDQNKWKKIGQAVCPVFQKVTLTSRGMTFSCENGTRKTRKGIQTNMIGKTINYTGGERLFRNGVWRFPEFMWRYKGVTLLLEGPAPAWDRLRIKAAEGERVLKAEDFFQLPAPPHIENAAPPAPSPAAPGTPADSSAAPHGES